MKYILFVLIIFSVSIFSVKADTRQWKMKQIGFLNIDRNEKDYGGFSGLVIQDEGSKALVVTDKSLFFVLELHRDEDDI